MKTLISTWMSLLLLPIILGAPSSFAGKNKILIPVDVEVGEGICKLSLKDLEKLKNRRAVFEERFIQPLVKVEQALMGASSAHEALMILTAKDFRQYLFRDEELAKFYKNAPWGNEFNKIKDDFKPAEDFLGAVTDANKLIDKAVSLEMPGEALRIIREDAKAIERRAEVFLKNEGWLETPPKKIRKLIERLNDMTVPTQEADAAYIESEINQKGREILETITDPRDLEKGFHPERRRIREIGIDLITLRGKVEIVDTGIVPKGLRKYQIVPDEAKKYLEIEETDFELKHKVKVAKSTYLTISYFINLYGEIKDRGELLHSLTDALIRARLYPDEVSAHLWLKPYLNRKIGWKDYVQDAINAHHELIASGVLNKITL